MYLIWVVHHSYALLGLSHSTVSHISPNSTPRHTTRIFLKRRMTFCNPFYYYCQNILHNITKRCFVSVLISENSIQSADCKDKIQTKKCKKLKKKGKCKDKKIWKKCMFTCQKCTQGTMLLYENKLTKIHRTN